MQILRKDLQLFPYKIKTLPHLMNLDAKRRYNFASEILRRINSEEIDPMAIWFTDECQFWTANYVNSQFFRFLGSETPSPKPIRPLKVAKTTVWVAFSGQGIIGPYFFDSPVNSESYQSMLEERFFADLRELALDSSNYWFQQDGAPPHRTPDVFHTLYSMFNHKVISLQYQRIAPESIEWPPYSPDLNPCDFFLWGYLKDRVYHNGDTANLNQLKASITEKIEAISTDTLATVVDSFVERCRYIVATQGRHFENVYD